MKSVRILAIAAVLLTALPAHSLDLKPQFVETELEGGFKNKEVVFADGERQVFYRYPRGWQPEVKGWVVRFIPADMPQTDFTIQAEICQEQRVIDAAEVKRLRDLVSASLPEGVIDVVFEPEQYDSLVIDRKPTVDVTAAYTHNNQRFIKNMLVLYTSNSIVRFSTVGRVTTFARAKTITRQSLFSWRWESAAKAKDTAATK